MLPQDDSATDLPLPLGADAEERFYGVRGAWSPEPTFKRQGSDLIPISPKASEVNCPTQFQPDSPWTGRPQDGESWKPEDPNNKASAFFIELLWWQLTR